MCFFVLDVDIELKKTCYASLEGLGQGTRFISYKSPLWHNHSPSLFFMLFPLKKRKLIRGFDDHIKAGLGGAADYEASFQPLYAPCDGVLFPFDEIKGGHWLRLTRENGERIEFAHLNDYKYKNKQCKAGDLIATTGNTGTETSGPHKHIQCLDKQGIRIDPEKYFRAFSIPVIAVNGTIPFMQEVQKKILEYSQGMLTISWDIVDYPISVAAGQFTQDQSYELVRQLYKDDLRPFRYIFLFYKGNATSAFAVTFYNPEMHNCITTCPVFDAKACAFEFAHMINLFYQTHKPAGFPDVRAQDLDSHYFTDELAIQKYRLVLPYTDILLKKTT